MIIVSGFVRSGTSMMMRALSYGGMQIVSDEIRRSDRNNKHGYFELEKIGKKIQENNSYLDKFNSNQCIKVISFFLENIKNIQNHSVIFMRRNMENIYASMEDMTGKKLSSEEKTSFNEHVSKVKRRLREHDNFVMVGFEEMLRNPKQELEKILNLIPDNFDIENAAGAVDVTISRHSS